MSLKIAVVVACVVVVVLGDHPPPPPPVSIYSDPPQYHPPPRYHAPVETYPDVPPKYTYNYGVADGYSGANYGHSENRDGYKTEGSYTVDLPDGRQQTVTYVDNGDGLEAVVTYEGEAQYPEQPPSYPKPYA
ncbi:pro-resilin-like [Homarus americanus]|uniref:pro-resilin-like n=1 Tax=Homarus americanus TaxID=6706 RepID=UPI001C4590BC|nr:pro-resilin-like [Homarus americanus]